MATQLKITDFRSHNIYVGVSNLAPTSKFVCARFRFRMMCSVDARFIRVGRMSLHPLFGGSRYQHSCCLMPVVWVTSERARE
jgi:hypothetical protein